MPTGLLTAGSRAIQAGADIHFQDGNLRSLDLASSDAVGVTLIGPPYIPEVRCQIGIDRKLISDVTVFDVYEGKGIDDGKKSIAIAVTMQPREKTMTDQEIDAVGARIVAEVTKKTGGTLRA